MEREDQWPDLLVDRRPIQERRGQVESLGEGLELKPTSLARWEGGSAVLWRGTTLLLLLHLLLEPLWRQVSGLSILYGILCASIQFVLKVWSAARPREPSPPPAVYCTRALPQTRPQAQETFPPSRTKGALGDPAASREVGK